jgi:hypothetical protein
VELILDKLGRIDHAGIEIRPLTVFVGENNTNKTWAAYCLWDLARRAMVGNPSGIDDAVLPIEPKEVEDAICAAVARAVGQSPKLIDAAVSVARQDLIHGINQTVTFRLSPADISALLHIDDPEARAALIATPEEFRAEASIAELRVDNSLRSVTVSYTGPGVPVKFAAQWSPSMGDDPVQASLTSILTRLAHGFMGRAVLLLLPAERKALVQIYKVLLDAGGALYGPRAPGQLLAVPALDQYMTKPPIHFLRFLKAAEAMHDPTAARFAAALQHLEGGILGGAVDYERVGEDVRLSFVRDDGNKLRMEATESLVRALAGLNLYLRHWANPGDLLIIDEPEMNAHPDAQLRITELLTYLVNKGIRVVLTTHSPYVLDHLSTLVEASSLEGDARTRIVERLHLQNHEALLRPEQLAVYRFDLDGKVTSIFDRETRSIDPSTFSDVGDAETNLFSEVLRLERGHGD